MDIDEAVVAYYQALNRSAGFSAGTGRALATHCSPMDCNHEVSWRKRAPETGHWCTHPRCGSRQLWACASDKWHPRDSDGAEVCAGCGLPRRHVELEVPKVSQGAAGENGAERAMLRLAGNLRGPLGKVLAAQERERDPRKREDFLVYIASTVHNAKPEEVLSALAARACKSRTGGVDSIPKTLEDVARAILRARGRLRKALGMKAPRRHFDRRAEHALEIAKHIENAGESTERPMKRRVRVVEVPRQNKE